MTTTMLMSSLLQKYCGVAAATTTSRISLLNTRDCYNKKVAKKTLVAAFVTQQKGFTTRSSSSKSYSTVLSRLFSTRASSSSSTTSIKDNQISGQEKPEQPIATTPVKKQKKTKEEKQNMGKMVTELDWDHYEFSLNPKKDRRFDKKGMQNNLSIEEEAQEDQQAAQKLNEELNAYQSLSPALVESASKVLEPYINADRLTKVQTVLKQRTKRTKFLFENPSNPSNVWACLRTIDSFGIQNVDVIIESGQFSGKQALSQKRGMRTAMGSAQWLTLRNHPSTKDAIRHIKEVEGYKIYASDLSPTSVDVRDIDWDSVGPVCIVMGNEERGISEEMKELADATFTLPMCGFAESFNLSVATSITLAHLSANSELDEDGRKGIKGPLRPGDMEDHEYNCLYLKGLLNSLPQKRTGKALLRQNGIELPEIFKFL